MMLICLPDSYTDEALLLGRPRRFDKGAVAV
jgi:hypothetical protein